MPVQYPRITCHPGTAGLIAILEEIPESREWVYSNFILVESFELCTGYSSGSCDLVIIPGYDLSEEKFYVADFIFEAKYSYQTISFAEFRAAYQSVVESGRNLNGEGGIVLWQVNHEASYKLDVPLIRESMEEYLNGYSYLDRCVKTYHQAPENVVGIEVYLFLIEGIGKSQEPTSDYRKCLHNLYDHKKLMVERIQYLLSKGYLDEEELVEKSIRIRNLCGMLCNMYLKYQIKREDALSGRVIKGLQEVEKLERELFQTMIEDLKTSRPFAFH